MKELYPISGPLMQISVDYPLIFRLFLAFIWGFGWAAYLQFTRNGKFLVQERTWLTVVVGIGVDLLISFPYEGGNGNWSTIAMVIATSSIGIIVRSLWNEQKEAEVNTKSYKLIWGLEDAIATNRKAIEQLVKILDASQLPQGDVSQLSKVLATLHRLQQIIQASRRGEYNQKNSPKIAK